VIPAYHRPLQSNIAIDDAKLLGSLLVLYLDHVERRPAHQSHGEGTRLTISPGHDPFCISYSLVEQSSIETMAPDLNTMPPSPRPVASSPRLTSRNTSRRTSTQMAPPAIPPTSPSLNILPSNQNAVNHSSPPLASPNMATIATGPAGVSVGDNTGVGAGPGPLRHPRPLTAADLHLQLEKEQEAVVRNRRLSKNSSKLKTTTG
jgi:hypothetical protein